MHKTTNLLIVFIFSMVSAASSGAQSIVNFDLKEITKNLITGSTRFSGTVDGIKMDASTSTLWDGDVGFKKYEGIYFIYENAFNSSITLTFDETIKLESFDIGYKGGTVTTDALEISINDGGNILTRTEDLSTVVAGNNYSFTNPFTVQAGTAITFTCKNPNQPLGGVSFSNLRVTVVPEPETYALFLGLAGLSLVAFRLKRR